MSSITAFLHSTPDLLPRGDLGTYDGHDALNLARAGMYRGGAWMKQSTVLDTIDQ